MFDKLAIFAVSLLLLAGFSAPAFAAADQPALIVMADDDHHDDDEHHDDDHHDDDHHDALAMADDEHDDDHHDDDHHDDDHHDDHTA